MFYQTLRGTPPHQTLCYLPRIRVEVLLYPMNILSTQTFPPYAADNIMLAISFWIRDFSQTDG